MVESLAVLGIILSMIRPPQQLPPQYHYQYPAQHYYQPQQQQVPYYVPQQQYYHPQSPQTMGSSYGAPTGPQSYYYGQPPTQTTHQTRY